MIKLDYTNISNQIIGDEGLDLAQSFNEYAPKIQEIMEGQPVYSPAINSISKTLFNTSQSLIFAY